MVLFSFTHSGVCIHLAFLSHFGKVISLVLFGSFVFWGFSRPSFFLSGSSVFWEIKTRPFSKDLHLGPTFLLSLLHTGSAIQRPKFNP